MTKIAVFPGTFDPLTKGHLDLIARTTAIFSKVIVAVADNAPKIPLFSLEERVAMIEAETLPYPQVSVQGFQGLLADFAQQQGASVVIRGLRAVSDFEYEFQLVSMNQHLMPEVETVFLMSGTQYSFISSSLIKEVAQLGGDISSFVPFAVQRALQERFSKH